MLYSCHFLQWVRQEVILKIQEIEGIDMDIGSMIQEESDEFKEWMTPERIESLNKGKHVFC